jgi:hypothetical protein
MVTRRRPSPPVVGDEPPRILPTVWHSWSPEADGACVVALRHYLERMDEMAAGVQHPPDVLAQLMLQVYLRATQERRGTLESYAG